MILIAGVDNYLNRTVETTTVVGAVLGLFALMLVVFLYVHRKNCLRIGNFHYFNQNILAFRNFQKRVWRSSFQHSNFDCEDDIFHQMQFQSINFNNNDETLSLYCSKDPFQTDQCIPAPVENHITKDALGLAERGKMGVVSYYNECIANEPNEIIEPAIGNVLKASSMDMKSYKKLHHPTKASEDVYCSPMKETRIDNQMNSLVSSATASKHNQMFSSFPDIGLDERTIIHSSQDCILILPQEPLFESSDLKSPKSDITRSDAASTTPPLPSTYVEISLLYDAPLRKMTVHVLQAKGVPSRSPGQQTHTQIRLLMLPAKKQKHKTKIRSGESPQFMESFLLHRVNPEEVNSMGLRVRVYGCERMRKERLIGEAVVSFANINLELETNLWLPLESRNDPHMIDSSSDILSLARSDSICSTKSEQHGGVPELLLGLAYNGTTGRLIIEIVKGSHLRGLTLHKSPDTYVKLCLVNSIGQEMARAKTSTRRGQSNPLFKEAFAFQVTMFQLNDVTLMVSVYAKRNMKRNEMVGWFSLGLNSSGPEEMAHWVDMRDHCKGELLCRWHVLVDS